MRAFVFAAALLGALGPLEVQADAGPVIVVFELEDTRERRARLPRAQLQALTQFMHTQLAMQGRFQIVPSSELRAALQAQKKSSYKACYDETCQIEIGKELAAEKSVATKLAKVGSQCLLTATVYDLAKSTTEAAATHKGKCEPDALVGGLERVAGQLRGDRRASAGFARAVVDIGELISVDVDANVGAGFAGLDVQYLERVQAAKRLEKAKGPVDVSARAKAWQAVAAHPGDNPLKEAATQRADYWRRVGTLKIRFEADHAKLDKLLALDDDVLPAPSKAAAKQEFTETYARYLPALAAVGVKLPWKRLPDGRFCPYGATLRRGGTKMQQCMLGKVKHGPYALRRRSETLQGEYRHGDKSGLWITTRKQSRSECRFAKGKREGRCVEWNLVDGEKAGKRSECSYRAGKKHGPCVLYRTDGGRTESKYAEGRLEGMSTTLDAAGNKGAEEPYEQGRLHGTVRRFFDDGSVSEATEYVDGKRHGLHRRYHRGGKVKLQGRFERGRRHGEFVRLDPEGQVLARMAFDRGTGELVNVDPRGKVLRKTRFERGQARETTSFDAEGRRRRKQYFGPQGAKIGQWSVWDTDGKRCCETDYSKIDRSGCHAFRYFFADGSRAPKLTGARARDCRTCDGWAVDNRFECQQAKAGSR